MSDPVKLLLVEDDEDDYLITRGLLEGQDRTPCRLEWCASYEQAVHRIAERRHDAYLIDYRLGGCNGLELIREAFGGRPQAPVILLTGQGDWQVDLEATELGVTDFLVKRGLDSQTLERSIRYAVSQHRAMRDLRRSEERYALAVRAAHDGIWDWDVAEGRMYFSPRWYAILGRREQEFPARPESWWAIVHPDDIARLRLALDAHLEGRTPFFESEHRIRHADESWRWVLSRGLAIRDDEGAAVRIGGSLSDVHDRHQAEERLVHGALHDALTGLPNRALFMDRLAQALSRAARDPHLRSAVLFVDIDRFKVVNDSLSHAVGDELLIGLARRMAAALRPADTVARLGGDEFTILLDSVEDGDAALAVCERVQGALREPFVVDGHELVVSASIGVALGAPGERPTDLLRNADIAMYDAKGRGGARSELFDESMHRRAVSRLAQETALRQAIEQRTLRTFFQPIVELAGGRLVAFEALARWPDGVDQVSPAEFVPIAEESGLIGALGERVLHSALEGLATWRASGVVDESVGIRVNVSARQLTDPTLSNTVHAALRRTGIPAHALGLEITESTLMEDPPRVRAALARLLSLGTGLELDDFGTGYSSLTLLHHFPGDTLKIDRSFVATVLEREESEVIVRSIIALGHSLGLRVIAEGVERAEQASRLRELGCEFGQGFLFAAPMPADEVPRLQAMRQLDGVAPVVAVG